MPKWNKRESVIPLASKKPIIVDFSPPISHEGDPRVPIKPTQVVSKDFEELVIDSTPTPDGLKYTIVNNGASTYTIVLTNESCDQIWGIKTTQKEGIIPLKDVQKHTGSWTGVLIKESKIINSTTFSIILTLDWILSTIGQIEIRYSTSDGPLDRLGCIQISKGSKKEPTYSHDIVDFVIVVLFPELSESFSKEKLTLEIVRPDTGGVYWHTDMPIVHYMGYRVCVKDHFPSADPGRWVVRVLSGTRILSKSSFEILPGGSHTPLCDKEAVAEFDICLQDYR